MKGVFRVLQGKGISTLKVVEHAKTHKDLYMKIKANLNIFIKKLVAGQWWHCL